STTGGEEYHGSGDGLGRYRSGVRSCGGAGRNTAIGSGNPTAEDPAAGSDMPAAGDCPATTQARDIIAATTARPGRGGRRDVMGVRYRAPRPRPPAGRRTLLAAGVVRPNGQAAPVSPGVPA